MKGFNVQGVFMNANKENQKVDLDAFANLAGFPVDLIKKELFKGQENDDEISISDLRKAMVAYLDSTMMEN